MPAVLIQAVSLRPDGRPPGSHVAMLWQVPRGHPEIERLEGRYRSQGGLRGGMLVELANGDTALVVAAGERSVRLDANGMMAGKARVFELELVALEPGR